MLARHAIHQLDASAGLVKAPTCARTAFCAPYQLRPERYSAPLEHYPRPRVLSLGIYADVPDRLRCGRNRKPALGGGLKRKKRGAGRRAGTTRSLNPPAKAGFIPVVQTTQFPAAHNHDEPSILECQVRRRH